MRLSQCGGGKDRSRPLRCALEKQTKGGWTPGTVLKSGCLLYILKESLHHSCLVLGFCPDIHPLAPTSPVVGSSPPRGPSWSVFLLNILLWVIHVCVCQRLSCSDSLQSHGLYPARFLRPWTSPGQNTEVGGAIPFSRGSSHPRDRTWISCLSCTGKWILYCLSHQGRLWVILTAQESQKPLKIRCKVLFRAPHSVKPQSRCGKWSVFVN